MGGVLTVLAYIFIAFYALALFKDVVIRKKHISTNQFLAEFDRPEVLTPHDFSFAFLTESNLITPKAFVKPD